MSNLIEKIKSLINLPLKWEAEHPIDSDSSGWGHTSLVSIIIALGTGHIARMCFWASGVSEFEHLVFLDRTGSYCFSHRNSVHVP